MKKRYYYICMLSVLLLMLVLPTKAASEAEFGKLVKSYSDQNSVKTILQSMQ